MKRKISFIFCLFAVLGWTAHSLVPHHHVGSCAGNNVMEEICWGEHFHHHHHHGEAHESDCQHDSEHHGYHTCIFTQMLPLAPEKAHLHLPEVQNSDKFLVINCENSSYRIFRTYTQQKYRIFNAWLFYSAEFLDNSGLRAPPAA